jgi:hypothetical protein
MSRHRSFPNRARVVLGALLLASGVTACDEDGKTTPARCSELPIFDIQNAGAPADDNARYNDAEGLPCVTEVGHAISKPAELAAAGGTSAAGTTSTGGKPVGAGGDAADAGAGGS